MKKARSGGGTELVVCVIILVVLGIVCGVLWVKRSQEELVRTAEATRNRKAREENISRAFKAFLLAQSAGHDFVIGKKTDATRESLVSSVQGDPNVYNAIFTWTYKKKSQTIPVQHALYTDNEHMNIQQTSKGTVKEGISITYGYNNRNEPIMIATKYYPAPDGDKNNLGGEIMVIVNAERE